MICTYIVVDYFIYHTICSKYQKSIYVYLFAPPLRPVCSLMITLRGMFFTSVSVCVLCHRPAQLEIVTVDIFEAIL